MSEQQGTWAGRVPSETLNAERIRFLYRSPVATISNLGVAAVFAYVARDHFGLTIAAGWLAIMAAVIAVRLLIWWTYRRGRGAGSVYRRWALLFEVGAAVNGLLWALPAIDVLTRAPTEIVAVYATIIGVMMAGMVFSTSVWTRAFIIFLLTTGVLPILIALFHPDSVHRVFGLLGVIYLGAILAWGRSAGQMFTETLRLRLENIMLAGEVAIAREQALAVEKTRHEGFAGLSHELRTPLNAIIGFGQAMETELWGELGSPRYQEYAHNIVHAGQHLDILINGALDLSRIATGKMELEEVAVDLGAVARDCQTLITNRAQEKQIAVEVKVPPEMPRLRADPAKLRQVLLNLLTNAVKFTPEGGQVKISVEHLQSGDLEVVVSDTGVGIPAEELDRVMEPFVRGGQARVRDTEGLGLGLALARSLTELHGGSLTLQSELGAGTTARLILPRSRLISAA